jgi:hypothetical protein
MQADEGVAGVDGARRHLATHRRCAEEWGRWIADGTAPMPFEPVIETGPVGEAAALLFRFGLQRHLHGHGGPGQTLATGGPAPVAEGVPDAR